MPLQPFAQAAIETFFHSFVLYSIFLATEPRSSIKLRNECSAQPLTYHCFHFPQPFPRQPASEPSFHSVLYSLFLKMDRNVSTAVSTMFRQLLSSSTSSQQFSSLLAIVHRTLFPPFPSRPSVQPSLPNVRPPLPRPCNRPPEFNSLSASEISHSAQLLFPFNTVPLFSRPPAKPPSTRLSSTLPSWHWTSAWPPCGALSATRTPAGRGAWDSPACTWRPLS